MFECSPSLSCGAGSPLCGGGTVGGLKVPMDGGPPLCITLPTSCEGSLSYARGPADSWNARGSVSWRRFLEEYRRRNMKNNITAMETAKAEEMPIAAIT